MSYFLPDSAYDVLKWTGLIALPAAATLASTVLPVWGVPDSLVSAITVTLNGLGVFVGALLAASTATAKEESGVVGETTVED